MRFLCFVKLKFDKCRISNEYTKSRLNCGFCYGKESKTIKIKSADCRVLQCENQTCAPVSRIEAISKPHVARQSVLKAFNFTGSNLRKPNFKRSKKKNRPFFRVFAGNFLRLPGKRIVGFPNVRDIRKGRGGNFKFSFVN